MPPMTPRRIAILCFRVLAAYTMIVAVGRADQIAWALNFGFWGPRGGWMAVITSLIGATVPILQFLVGLWLWKRAGVVAAWVVEHDLQDEPDEPDAADLAGEPITAASAEPIVLCSLGVWVLATTLPEALARLTQTVVTRQLFDTARSTQQYDWRALGQLVALLGKLIIGLWLIFGARGLVRLLVRARTLGLEKREDPS
jgi:hypothetical protein